MPDPMTDERLNALEEIARSGASDMSHSISPSAAIDLIEEVRRLRAERGNILANRDRPDPPKCFGVFRIEADANEGKEYFFAALWHNETRWGEGHRVVAGRFVSEDERLRMGFEPAGHPIQPAKEGTP